jgi:hypothetical protein
MASTSKPQKEHRTVIVALRLTPSEREMLRKMADWDGTDESSILRRSFRWQSRTEHYRRLFPEMYPPVNADNALAAQVRA